ncbi:MAG: tRNA pseudouridine(13) synthase TruD [Candidatus Azotimanducaceae bacterium]
MPYATPVVIKTTPEDWRVIEELHPDRLADIRTSKEGEHLYLLVQKENFNTLEVVGFLAEFFKQKKISIGYCGRKDKRAVTEQWFSVPTAREINLDEVLAPGIRIIERGRFKKKLRIGEHAYNRFEILLREVKAKPSELLQAQHKTFLNFYGPQRHNERSLAAAFDWIKYRRRKNIPQRFKSWNLSVLRSFLFNKILEKRRDAGCEEKYIEGDQCIDSVPTAPLWGRGRSSSKGKALELEREALAPFKDVCEALEYAGVHQGRRKIFEKPYSFSAHYDEACCTVDARFCLAPGTYATVFLGEYFDLREAS